MFFIAVEATKSSISALQTNCLPPSNASWGVKATTITTRTRTLREFHNNPLEDSLAPRIRQ